MAWIRVLIPSLWIVAYYCATVKGWEREITSELNPGCPDILCNGTFRIAHIKAKGPNDTLHYVWDLTKKPSLLLALTTHNATVSFNLDCIGNGKECNMIFSEKPLYRFGIVFNKMWEFNDVNDTGIFDQTNKSNSYVRVLNTEHFSWNRTVFDQDSRSVSIGVKSEQYVNGNTIKNGTVKLLVKGFGYLDHSEMLPHLLHTPNTSQVDFVIDGLTTEPSFSNSRFALELVLLGSDQTASNIQIVERQSLDDEHAPGVFTLVDVETPDSAGSAKGGYLQWRPVAYISSVRDVANSTDATIYSPQNVTNPVEDLKGTLILSGFCSNDTGTETCLNATLVQATAVSFGLKEDGFYKKTKYMAW
ncbi:Glycosylated lysosomal membrane protein [Gryllus bimaculatus]|nr:Glycosylated lysosomal membrane protein [Gryllus bimaculatus]